MINFDFESYCYSCEACSNVCPTKAISMEPNRYGFLIPNIDEQNCIKCNKCEKVCIHLNVRKQDVNIFNSNAYAAYNLDENTRLKSSSGGIFKLIADDFIKDGGYVCGCIWDDKMQPVHIVSNNNNDILNMMGSKYIQSRISECYDKIRELVNSDKKVLFTGTPCQTKAIYEVIGDNPNLYSMTVICHGVSSPLVWKKYIRELEEKHGKVKEYYLKDKTIGWRDMCSKIVFSSNKTIIKALSIDAFYQKAFIKSLLVKERCLTCEYKGENIKSDFIVGDFWGLPPKYYYLDDDKGLSCILTLNEKGESIFEGIRNNIRSESIDREIIFNGNRRIITPTLPHPKRLDFIQEFVTDKYSVSKLLERYIGPQSINERIKLYLKIGLKKVGLYNIKHKIRMYQMKKEKLSR